MSDLAQPAVTSLVESWLANRPPGTDQISGPVTVIRSEVLRPGRPGLLDIVADVGGQRAHLVVGLRAVGDETHFLRAGEEHALGLLETDDGLAVCTDALRDAQLGPLLLATVRNVPPRPGSVALVREDDEVTVLDCGDRGDLTVFPWLADGPRASVDLMMGLEQAGFNHVAAPLVRWTWEGHDLGLVQEPLVDRSGGWALALTSLRDLYASGGLPEEAGGDFGPEAHALGTMAARMHLALDRAFLRHLEPVAGWVDEGEQAVMAADPSLLEAPGVAAMLAALRQPGLRLAVLRTHGDFGLARTARTDHGWVVTDCAPGGVLPGSPLPGRRSPLCDVADLLWSLHQASVAAAAERDPAGRLGLAELGQAWEARNRRALVGGYLGTPGIAEVVGADRDLVLHLVSFFELTRSVDPGKADRPQQAVTGRRR
jgi:maltokinase